MVFVKGGDFMMGDVGYTDENGVKRHFAGDADVFPVHQVNPHQLQHKFTVLPAKITVSPAKITVSPAEITILPSELRRLTRERGYPIKQILNS
jgi:hypothetical protein